MYANQFDTEYDVQFDCERRDCEEYVFLQHVDGSVKDYMVYHQPYYELQLPNNAIASPVSVQLTSRVFEDILEMLLNNYNGVYKKVRKRIRALQQYEYNTEKFFEIFFRCHAHKLLWSEFFEETTFYIDSDGLETADSAVVYAFYKWITR